MSSGLDFLELPYYEIGEVHAVNKNSPANLEKDRKRLKWIFALGSIVLVVVTGGSTTIFLSLMNNSNAKFRSFPPMLFMSPLFQTILNFLGMKLVGDVVIIAKEVKDWITGCCVEKSNFDVEMDRNFNRKPPAKWYHLLLTSLFDILALFFEYWGLSFSFLGTFQMILNIQLVFTYFLVILFVKKRIFPHQSLGVLFTTVGIFFASLANVIETQESGETGTWELLAAPILIGIGAAFEAVHHLIEEYTFTRYDCTPRRFCSVVGLYGLIFSFFLAGILYLLDWPKNLHPREFPYILIQLISNPYLLALSASVVVMRAIFHITTEKVVVDIGVVGEKTIDAMTILLVWAYELGTRQVHFEWVEFIGFVFVVLGMAVYNRIFKIAVYDTWFVEYVDEHGETFEFDWCPCVTEKRMERKLMALIERDEEELKEPFLINEPQKNK